MTQSGQKLLLRRRSRNLSSIYKAKQRHKQSNTIQEKMDLSQTYKNWKRNTLEVGSAQARRKSVRYEMKCPGECRPHTGQNKCTADVYQTGSAAFCSNQIVNSLEKAVCQTLKLCVLQMLLCVCFSDVNCCSQERQEKITAEV